ncbi:MAG: hypothetical protein A2V84_12745 [Chloroflexi bacterium RBG_16_70_13]|nr:MAG: hypothetical protein A2V84_12745 [Chloroflexi bacterium RBG_16_70_13]
MMSTDSFGQRLLASHAHREQALMTTPFQELDGPWHHTRGRERDVGPDRYLLADLKLVDKVGRMY